MGYDANNDYHQSVGYFAYDEAKVVNIVLKFKIKVTWVTGFIEKANYFKKQRNPLAESFYYVKYVLSIITSKTRQKFSVMKKKMMFPEK